MRQATKIATCCYCGARAALVLRGKERHELACSNCGAPLHEMKTLRADHEEHGTRELVRPSPVRTRSKKPSKSASKPKKHRAKKKAPKRRKGFLANMFEEAFDVIEDIFD